jgi:NADH-quinone oxidoreductase subunit L
MAGNTFNGDLYVWANAGDVKMAIGFLIDPLTALMLIVVTFVSLMVHIYTIGYMATTTGTPASSATSASSRSRCSCSS